MNKRIPVRLPCEFTSGTEDAVCNSMEQNYEWHVKKKYIYEKT